MPENENILIDARNVNVEYETYHALHDIMLSIKAGELVAIIGPTGSGKTTLIKLLLGYYPVMSGAITIAGKDINDYNMKWWRTQCGVVMH